MVKETKAPDGYMLDDKPQTVELKASETQTLTFRNIPKQTVIVQKYVEGTTNPLPGVTFLVTDGDGKRIGTGEYVTDANGRIELPGVNPGTTVIAREVKTAGGYALNGSPKSLEVKVGTLNSLTFYDEPLSTLIIKKYIEGTANEPLAGVAFKVVDGSGANVGTDDGVFYTDNAGEIRIENLEAGRVIKVREIKTVDGFVLDGTPQDILIQSGSEQELVFWNKRQGTLTISKTDSVTGQPLSGVEFKVAYADGREIGDGRYFTDNRGEINITGINGTVTVTETATIPGYVMDAGSRTQTVTVNPMEGRTVTFTNTPMQTLTVHKFIQGTTTPIPGAVFKISDSSGTILGNNNGEFTTDSKGEITISGLIPGTTVTAQEICPASRYAPNSEAQSIKIKPGDAQTLTFYNTPLENLTIQKYAEGTTTSLAGVMFYVTDGAGTPVGSGEFSTDDNGRITIPGFTPGDTVIVREVKTVKGYALNGTPKTLKIASGQENTLTFYDAPLSVLLVHKYVDGTANEPLSGVTFKVTDASGKNVGNADGIYVTDASGDITVPNLEAGTVVKVREIKTVDGYLLNGRPQVIEITKAAVNELTFWNVPAQTLIIEKRATDTDAPLQGVTFTVRDSGGTYIGNDNGEFTTDQNGQIVICGLVPGVTITAQEKKTVSGYVLDETPQSILIQKGDAQKLIFRNEPKGALTVRKIDAVTGKPLSGAEFRILTISGNPVDDNEGRTSTNGVYTTDANGEIVIAKLQPGVYKVSESKAPDGYILDTTAQTVTVNANDSQTLTFRDVPTQSLLIQKYIDGTTKPLSGVTFLVTDTNGNRIGNGEYITDSNGQVIISGLTPGMSLVVREVKTVKGYVLNGTPQTVQISATGTNAVMLSAQATPSAATSNGNSLTFYDEPLSTLVVHKYVKGTDNQPLAGVTFKVVDGTGKNVGNSDGIFVTDDNGDITIPNLEPGTIIKVREVKTVDGYVLDGTPQDIQIQNSELHELTFYNSPKGSLSVVKLDSLTEKPLSGAEFRVTTSKGEFVDQNEGETSTNGVYRTDESGRFTISGLMPGSYVVTEIKAPDGYVLDSEPQTVTVNANDAQTLTFRDAPTQTLIVEVFVTDTTTPIPGTTFIVTAQDGKPVGNANGEFIADENGRITIPDLTPGMSVTVKETKAATGYLPDGTPKTILIKSGDAQNLRFYNSPSQTLTVQMFVSGTTTPVSGVTFHITDSDGKVIGNTNGDFVTDKDGQIVISGLIPGTNVTVKETKTVSGYILDTTPQTIEVRSGDAQSLTFFNAPKGALVVRAVDSVTDESLPGVEFKIVSVNGEPLDSNEGRTSSNGIYKTDDSGTVTVTKVQPGIYNIVETKVPDGYVLNEEPQTVTVNADDTQTLVFRNVPKQTLTIQVYTHKR